MGAEPEGRGIPASREREAFSAPGWVLASVSIASGTTVGFILCLPPALPLIQRDLGASFEELLWIPNAYTIAQGALLVLGGSLGDRLGYRRVYVPAMGIFAVALAICALAPNGLALIGLAVLVGGVSALMLGNALSVLAFAYAPARRSFALALWGVGLAAFYALTPVLGGAIAQYFSWRLTFVALALLASFGAFAAVRSVSAAPAPAAPRGRDIPGAALLTLGMALIVAVLIEGNRLGWGSPPIVAAAICGLGSLGALLAWELRAPAPILDFTLLKEPAIRAAALGTLGFSMGMFAMVFYLPALFSEELGATPAESALMLLGATGTGLLASLVTVRLRRGIDDRVLLVSSLALMAAGALLTSQVKREWTYESFLPGLIVFGLGLGSFSGPLAAIVAAAAGPVRSGLANSLVYSCRMIGSAIGIAGFGALLQVQIRAALDGIPGGSRSEVIGAVAYGDVSRAAIELPLPSREAFEASARFALVDGIGEAFLALGIAFLGVTIACAWLLRSRRGGGEAGQIDS